jgi:hypothetical protein
MLIDSLEICFVDYLFEYQSFSVIYCILSIVSVADIAIDHHAILNILIVILAAITICAVATTTQLFPTYRCTLSICKLLANYGINPQAIFPPHQLLNNCQLKMPYILLHRLLLGLHSSEAILT